MPSLSMSDIRNCPLPSFRWKWLLQLELVAVSIALALPLLRWSFGQRMTPAQFFESRFFSFIHSTCITFIMYVVMPTAWIWTLRFGFVRKWGTRIVVLAVGTAIGCLVAGLAPLVVYGSGHYDYWTDFLAYLRLGLLVTALVTSFFAAYETLKSCCNNWRRLCPLVRSTRRVCHPEPGSGSSLSRWPGSPIFMRMTS
jgi:hypothetical protein